MIEYIRGELAALTPAQAVIEAAGVGYALGISLNTYTVLQGKREVKLYVHEAIVTGGRDDSYTPLRLCHGTGARPLSPAHHRLGCGSQYGADDPLFDHAEGTLQHHRRWRRADAEKRERHWCADGAAHHRRSEGQNSASGIADELHAVSKPVGLLRSILPSEMRL